VGVVAADVTGRDRIAFNVLCSWAGHVVFVVSGFIMPRLIDDRLGQATLGVWDFCWSMVAYFELAQVGVGASINRDVARHRAQRDFAALRGTVSSAVAVQWTAALVALVMSAAAMLVVPLYEVKLGSQVETAQLVVALLGATVAVELAFNSYRGVVSGCHRWDVQNLVASVTQMLVLPAMALALVRGGGLPSLAAITLTSTIAREIVRAIAAHRLCPEIGIGPGRATWSEVRRLISFGSKLSAINLVGVALYQINVLLVLGYAGVAALAIYSRPLALMRHMSTFGGKFAMVLTPTAGSLDDGRSGKAIGQLVLTSTRYSAYLLWPPLTVLGIMGDALLRLWMGAGYDQSSTIAILAFGHLYPLAMQPVMAVLIGLNRHGPLVWVSVVAGVVGVLISAVTVGVLGWGVDGAAAAVVAAITVGAVACTGYACRVLELPVGTFLRKGVGGPAVVLATLGAALVMVRLITPDQPGPRLLGALVASTIVLVPVYWARVLPSSVRARVRGAVTRRIR
jgi:O-antigen/teichoic acid export membrane protein